MERAGHVVAQREPGQPRQCGQCRQRHRKQNLDSLGQPRGWSHRAFGDLRRRIKLVEEAGQRAEPRMVVQVGDGDLGILLPQPGDELRGAKRATSKGEEIRFRTIHRRREQSRHKPASQPAVPPRVGRPLFRAAGRWPRQRVPVDLARRSGRQLVDLDQAGYQRGG